MSQYYDPSPTSEFYFDVANLNYPNHNVLTVFGQGNSSTDVSTIWNHGGIYTYPNVAVQMTISSSSASDDYGVSGAQQVYIQGLDANWDEISETINLDGQNPVTTTKSYLRINSVNVVAGALNIGNIYLGTGTVTDGVPAVIYGEIVIGYGSVLQSMYSVPRGHTAYMLNGSISCGTTAANKYVTAYLMSRPLNQVLITRMITTLSSGHNLYSFDAPIRFEAKTDIQARCQSSSGTDYVSSHYQFVIVKE